MLKKLIFMPKLNKFININGKKKFSFIVRLINILFFGILKIIIEKNRRVKSLIKLKKCSLIISKNKNCHNVIILTSIMFYH